MSNPIHLRTQTPLRLRLSGQARLHFAQLMLWQILAFMALLAVFLLHSCGILTDQSHSIGFKPAVSMATYFVPSFRI